MDNVSRLSQRVFVQKLARGVRRLARGAITLRYENHAASVKLGWPVFVAADSLAFAFDPTGREASATEYASDGIPLGDFVAIDADADALHDRAPKWMPALP